MNRRTFLKNSLTGIAAVVAFPLAVSAKQTSSTTKDDSSFIQYCVDNGISIHGGEYNLYKPVFFGRDSFGVMKDIKFNMYNGSYFHFYEADDLVFTNNILSTRPL